MTGFENGTSNVLSGLTERQNCEVRNRDGELRRLDGKNRLPNGVE